MAFVQVPQFQMPQQSAPPVSVAARSPLVQELLAQSMQPMGPGANYSGAVPNPISLMALNNYFKNNQGVTPGNANGGSTGTGTPGLMDQLGAAMPGGFGWGNSYVPGSGMFGGTLFGTPWASSTAPGGGQSVEPL